ncbi:MAG: type II toxin-antitoxin system VapC family toxin [Nitrospinae bacterium]|nr:type II toxin-antitoxin system VapC family toxin [Nitrospinota bacterium]
MIAIDTSALVSILLDEPEAGKFALAIQNDDEPLISAASFVELVLVMKYKQGPNTKQIIDRLIKIGNITIAPVTAGQAHIAGEATREFSELNYGDTFSYALAQDRDVPLLFKGADFSHTDVTMAAY